MAGRYGGRFGTNQEQEQRRIQKEPVVVWKQEWVLPAGAPTTSTVKILKWVRTGAVIKFDEEEEVGEETMAMDVDVNASSLLDPLQSVSAIDSLAVTPTPEVPALSDQPIEIQPPPEEPALAPETVTPSGDLAAQASGESIAPSIEVEGGTILEEASQPLYTQPSVVSSQDPLTGSQELLDSSQPFGP